MLRCAGASYGTLWKPALVFTLQPITNITAATSPRRIYAGRYSHFPAANASFNQPTNILAERSALLF